MEKLLEFYKNQNREQRQLLDEKDEIIKALKREEYEVKQSIFRELSEIVKIGQSNDINKNIKMLDKLEMLIDDLCFDIKEYLTEQSIEDYKKELISDYQSEN